MIIEKNKTNTGNEDKKDYDRLRPHVHLQESNCYESDYFDHIH
jgi:hypothetical protein